MQNKVFVDLMIHLSNRGRENLREMNRFDFTISTDSNNHRYVKINDKLAKNHRCDINDENSKKERMYETMSDVQLLCLNCT